MAARRVFYYLAEGRAGSVTSNGSALTLTPLSVPPPADASDGLVQLVGPCPPLSTSRNGIRIKVRYRDIGEFQAQRWTGVSGTMTFQGALDPASSSAQIARKLPRLGPESCIADRLLFRCQIRSRVVEHDIKYLLR